MKQDVVIIGAGICGLTTAYQIKKNNPQLEITLIEKLSEVGGLARSTVNDQGRFDIGSHRLHPQTDERILAFIREEMGVPLQSVNRKGHLRLLNKWLPYPLNLFSILKGLGPLEFFKCGFFYVLATIKRLIFRPTMNNYRDALINNVGTYAYKIFYEPYAIKVWDKDPQTISLSAVKKRVSTTNPLKFLIESLFSSGNKKPAQFLYPSKGMGDLSDRVVEKLEKMGVTILSSTEIQNINCNEKILELKDSSSIQFDKLISTISMNNLLPLLSHKDEKLKQVVNQLQWRGMSLVYLSFDEEILLQGETFYFPETKYRFGRVSVPKRFSQAATGELLQTTITCEVAGHHAKEDLQDLTQQCVDQLKSIKLLREELSIKHIKSTWMHLNALYPIYQVGWEEQFESALKMLKSNFSWLYTTGKMGLFLHSNIDHSIHMGLELGNLFSQKDAHEQWYNLVPSFQNFKIRD